MNLATIDIVIIFLYLAVIVGLGFWISKKASKISSRISWEIIISSGTGWDSAIVVACLM